MNETLKKIDDYLELLEAKKKKRSEEEMQKNKKGEKVPFLYKTEGVEIFVEEGSKEEYKKVFNALAKKHGFDPEDIENLPADKKKAFFNELDKKWKAKKETD